MRSTTSALEPQTLADWTRKLLADDSPYYAIASLIPALAGFLGIAFFTRLLSPHDYGNYTIALNTVLIVDGLAFGWLNQATLRYFPEQETPDTLNRFLSSLGIAMVVLVALILAVWVATTILLDRLIDHELVAVLQVSALLMVSRAGFNLVATVLRARRQTRKYALYYSLTSLGGTLIAAWFLLVYGPDPKLLFYGFSIPLVLVVLSRFLGHGFRFTPAIAFFSADLIRKCASYGIPVVIFSFGALLLSLADRYMLGYFNGSAEVGIYAAGYDLADKGLKVFFTILTAASFPIVIQTLARRGQHEAEAVIRETVALYFLLMVPLTVGVILLRGDLAGMVLGVSFVSGAGPIIPYIAVGTFFWGLCIVIAQVFQVHASAHLLAWLILCGGAINIGLNLVLIPKHGALGAAMSTTVSYCFCLASSWVASERLFRLSFSLSFVFLTKIAIAALGMALSILLLEAHSDCSTCIWAFMSKVLLGAFAYLALLVALREERILSFSGLFRR